MSISNLECVRSQVPNKMVKQSETPTKYVGKQLFRGDHDDYNKCVLFLGERMGEISICTDTRSHKYLNLKHLTAQWDFFIFLNNGF